MSLFKNCLSILFSILILGQISVIHDSSAETGFYDILKSNISQNGDDKNIEVTFTENFYVSIYKPYSPNWTKVNWSISTLESNGLHGQDHNPTACSEDQSNANLFQLRCEARNFSGKVSITATNANNTDQQTNPVTVTIKAPKQGRFISCINPPANFTPTTCIDVFKNGAWNRNDTFSCLSGYSKSGKNCVLISSNTSRTQDCYIQETYQSNNQVTISLLDKKTYSRSNDCNAISWDVQIRSGSENAVRELGRNQKEIILEIFSSAEILVEADLQNLAVGKILNVEPTQTAINKASDIADIKLTSMSKTPWIENNYSYINEFGSRVTGDVLLINTNIKNIGKTTFSETAAVNGKEGNWSGIIICDDNNETTGVVRYGNLAAGASKEVKLILDISSLKNTSTAQKKCTIYSFTRSYTQINPAFNTQNIEFNLNLDNNIITISEVHERNWTNISYYFTNPGVLRARRLQAQITSFPQPTTPVTQIQVNTPGNVEYEEEVKVKFKANENPFSDTKITSLAGSAAAELNRRNVIGGFPDGEFKGSRTVNRAEAAKFLLLARGYDVPSSISNSRFSDTLPGEWYAKYTERAAEIGVIKGYNDGTFRPANQVITAEFLKMIAVTFNLQTNLSYSYQDESEYPNAWFWQYAGAAQKYELFPHRKTHLRPTTPLSRNEIAVAIYQYLKNRSISSQNLPISASIPDDECRSYANQPLNFSISCLTGYRFNASHGIGPDLEYIQFRNKKNSSEFFSIKINDSENFTNTQNLDHQSIRISGISAKTYYSNRDQTMTITAKKDNKYYQIQFNTQSENIPSKYKEILESISL
ncbi:MAG: S-layer homology domain-containing protein [Candidatus Gracilibacteria bacterium]|nr:S-layer homology domain-containing protein [Candidatus Gracilibacteria bacterium]